MLRNCAFLLLPVFLLIAGCLSKDEPTLTPEQLAEIPFPQRTGLPEASGGFVIAVGGETITTDEIVLPWIERFRPVAQRNDFEQFARQARPQLEQIVINQVSDILLYQQAQKNAGEDIDERLEKAADREVKKFITSFGGDYAVAEQALKQKGMDWQSFKEQQKKMILIFSYVASQVPEDRSITYSELMDYYNKVKEKFFTTPATLQLRLIDIEPAKLEASDPNKSQLEQARDLANELMRRLRAGEDFGGLAEAHSHGYRRQFGGLWKPVQPASLAQPYDILVNEAEKMQPGQIAGPIEIAEHIFVMKLVQKQAESVEPFEKVQRQVEEKILEDQLRQAQEELGAKLVQQAALANKDQFVDFCLEEMYRICNQ